MTWGAGRRYIQGLDGLRGLAVLAVLAYHVVPDVILGGFIGVDVFFVLSGFLITTLLVDEYRASGRIQLRHFWLRRARRLLPALLLVICAVSSIILFVGGDIQVGIGRQIAGALTFSSNWTEIAAGSNYFDAGNLHPFTNFWSLAVEEQFYLIWPFVIFIGLRLYRRRYQTLQHFAVGMALISAILMALLFREDAITRVYYGADTHVFGLMLGAALAFWRYGRFVDPQPQQVDQFTPRRSLKRRALPLELLGSVALLVLLFAAVTLPNQTAVTYRGGLFLVAIAAAILIAAVSSYRGILQRLFGIRPLEWVGKRSYGIYLWHWPVWVLLHSTIPSSAPVWLAPLMTVLLTFPVAALSYRLLEIPIQKYGFIAFAKRSVHREAIAINDATTKWRLRPHPMLLPGALVVALTVVTVIQASDKTQAQRQIEAGKIAIQHAAASQPQAASSSPPTSAQKPSSAQPTSAPISGSDITLIGDSVSLASAPALEAKFPGILIDAAISRSLRNGGFDAIDTLKATGQLRRIVIIALGTNGYYGTGNLDRLMAELDGHEVVFVTAHAPDEWVEGNNQNLHETSKRYPAMRIAEWDDAISAHPEELSSDGIHPGGEGGKVYADCIATALQ